MRCDSEAAILFGLGRENDISSSSGILHRSQSHMDAPGRGRLPVVVSSSTSRPVDIENPSI
jgi:hypothetical protein